MQNTLFMGRCHLSRSTQPRKKKKDTILKMNQLYQNATCILAVPDLHREYLKKNTANKEILELIKKYNHTISEEIAFKCSINNNDFKRSITHCTLQTDNMQHINNDHYRLLQNPVNKR
ncbi:unnamed protein product [Cunninghamella blakesleeana]